MIKYENFEADAFEIVGYLSDTLYYAIEDEFMKLGGVVLAPLNDWKSFVYFEPEKYTKEKVIAIIESII